MRRFERSHLSIAAALSSWALGPSKAELRSRRAASAGTPCANPAVSTIASGLSPVSAHKAVRETAPRTKQLVESKSSDCGEMGPFRSQSDPACSGLGGCVSSKTRASRALLGGFGNEAVRGEQLDDVELPFLRQPRAARGRVEPSESGSNKPSRPRPLLGRAQCERNGASGSVVGTTSTVKDTVSNDRIHVPEVRTGRTPGPNSRCLARDDKATHLDLLQVLPLS